MRNAPAFTLIELLIVVAVVAMLAAIAVPNFLEAQMRSKASRARADMRSVATALESYRVDANRYPRTTFFAGTAMRLKPLTTPVSYMSSLPEDPFFRFDPDPGSFGSQQPQYLYCSGNVYHGTSTAYDSAQYIGSVYSLLSRGPDARIEFGYCAAHPFAVSSQAPERYSYDPTNGTISSGEIFRLSPGTLGG